MSEEAPRIPYQLFSLPLSGAFRAYTPDLHMPGLRPSPLQDFRGKLGVVEIDPVEISEAFAHSAEHVVMISTIRIESRFVLEELDSRNETATFKGGERPINGVQRNGRQAILDTTVDIIRRGVIMSTHYFPKNLQALRSNFDPPLFADLSEKV